MCNERRLVGVSAFCSLYCFDTVGWMTKRGFSLKPVPLILSPKVHFRKKVKKENRGNMLIRIIRIHLEKRPLKQR